MRVLVTGGGGFLGRYIVENLVTRGIQVCSLSRRRHPELDALGVETVQADLRDAKAIAGACKGCDAVFHAAALAGVWGSREAFYEINVDGTANVLRGCQTHGVRYLIYTSSPSVVWRSGDLINADESLSYPARFNCLYPETKAAAERMILAANGSQGMMTVSLRPHLIWGPRDTQLIPRILERARAGRLIRVGAGKNLVDIVYVENAADAHLLALDRLMGGGKGLDGSPVAGQAFFISQGEPVNLWNWINDLLERLELPKVHRAIPYRAAWLLGAAIELFYSAFRIYREPLMTRFVAHQLGASHYFNISRARHALGYAPRVSTEEGLARLIASIKNGIKA
ncbi:MAG: NAD-dependent epimerase/dehydratase family protein [Candidatus Sumerlaeota bacterium]|nr:NAD-dependent epimerase/dehydratase family protein [Candidatus Sumerlaeota bacterium]